MTTLRRQLEANPEIRDLHPLHAYFRNSCKPRTSQRIGCEFEWIVVDTLGRPVSYRADDGATGLFHQLRHRAGWTPQAIDGKWLLLRKGEMTIGLEPGGQIEYSSTPFPFLGDLLAEYVEVRSQCAMAAMSCHARLLAIGVHPTLIRLDQISWVPKARYLALANRLRTTGSLGHWMMKGTASIQVNLDYADEREFSDLLQAAVVFAPLGRTLFSNSPIWKRKVTGKRGFRSEIWRDTDPDRCGIPRFMRNAPITFDRYTQYALDVPALFCSSCPPGSHIQSFRRWIQSRSPHPPRLSDWDLHMTSLYPDARAKPHIEIRYVDALPDPFATSAVAFLVGLLGTDQGRQAVLAHSDRIGKAAAHCTASLRFGRSAVDVFRFLLRVASKGLRSQLPEPELALAPLRELWTERRCTVADLTRAEWRSAKTGAVFSARTGL